MTTTSKRIQGVRWNRSLQERLKPPSQNFDRDSGGKTTPIYLLRLRSLTLINRNIAQHFSLRRNSEPKETSDSEKKTDVVWLKKAGERESDSGEKTSQAILWWLRSWWRRQVNEVKESAEIEIFKEVWSSQLKFRQRFGHQITLSSSTSTKVLNFDQQKYC